MATDALSIVPLGRADTGEAAILPSGGFQDFSREILGIRRQEAKEQQQNQAIVGKLMQDEVKSNWASDNLNYFQPKMDELRKETVEMYKKNNGKLGPMEVFEIQSKWNKIKSEAEISNALYAEEVNRIKEIENDPQGEKFDVEQSRAMRGLWNNPYSDEDTKKEIEAAGGILKWRAQNSQKYGNVPSYNIEKDVQESFKDKVSTWQDRNKQGLVDWTDRGEFLEGKGFKGIDKEKIGTHYNTFWNRKTYKGQQFRKTADNFVKSNYEFTEDGKVLPNSEEAMKVAQNTELDGLSVEEKKQALAKSFGLNRVMAGFPTEQIVLTERKNKGNKINVNVNAGGGSGDPRTDFNWTVGSGTYTKTLDELSPNKVNFIKKYPNSQFAKDLQKEIGQGKFIAVTTKEGKQNATINLAGDTGAKEAEEVVGFTLKPNGGWQLKTTKSLDPKLTPNEAMQQEREEAEAAESGGIFKSPKKTKELIALGTHELDKDNTITTQIASQLGFQTRKELIDYLNKKAGIKVNTSTNVGGIFGKK